MSNPFPDRKQMVLWAFQERNEAYTYLEGAVRAILCLHEANLLRGRKWRTDRENITVALMKGLGIRRDVAELCLDEFYPPDYGATSE